MELPQAIKVGAYTYRVEGKDKVLNPANNDECYGYCNYEKHTIEVQTGLPEDRLVAALLHEALHGVSEILRIGLTEKQVVRLAPALVALLRDNPALAALLTKE